MWLMGPVITLESTRILDEANHNPPLKWMGDKKVQFDFNPVAVIQLAK